jgi:hypothetical protein
MGGRAYRVRVHAAAAPAVAKAAHIGWGQRLIRGETIRFT